MQKLNRILCCALLALVGLNSHVDAACESCMPNQVSCINETSFNMCYNGVRDTSAVFNCPDTYVCTQMQIICVPSGQIDPACPLTTTCDGCDGDKPFVCINRTQYAQCHGNVQTTNTGTCPSGMYCNTSTGLICVDECVGAECDHD